jgi:hypothetical protein
MSARFAAEDDLRAQDLALPLLESAAFSVRRNADMGERMREFSARASELSALHKYSISAG